MLGHFSLEEPKAQGRPLHVVLHWLKEGQCDQSVASSLALLVMSVLFAVVQAQVGTIFK